MHDKFARAGCPNGRDHSARAVRVARTGARSSTHACEQTRTRKRRTAVARARVTPGRGPPGASARSALRGVVGQLLQRPAVAVGVPERHEAPPLVHGAVMVGVEAELLDVELLRAVDVADGHEDEFDLPVHWCLLLRAVSSSDRLRATLGNHAVTLCP